MQAWSLFSGVGGVELGFGRAGIETVLQVESDPWCLSVLARHWPFVPRIDDVRKVDAATWTRRRGDVVGDGADAERLGGAARGVAGAGDGDEEPSVEARVPREPRPPPGKLHRSHTPRYGTMAAATSRFRTWSPVDDAAGRERDDDPIPMWNRPGVMPRLNGCRLTGLDRIACSWPAARAVHPAMSSN